MRILIGLAVLTATLAAGVAPGSAQDRAWCLREGFSGPGSCWYDTFAQCEATARGQGGSCIENIDRVWERRYGKQQKQKRSARRQQRQQHDDWGWNNNWR